MSETTTVLMMCAICDTPLDVPMTEAEENTAAGGSILCGRDLAVGWLRDDPEEITLKQLSQMVRHDIVEVSMVDEGIMISVTARGQDLRRLWDERANEIRAAAA